MESYECYDCGRMEGKFGIIQVPGEKKVHLCDICYGEWLKYQKNIEIGIKKEINEDKR